jgi:uncharacterized protein (TIGR00725 family)
MNVDMMEVRSIGSDMEPYVAVIGPGKATPEQEGAATRVGELLAEAGAVVISGGLGGVMRASCAGAIRSGGKTVGLLPGRERQEGNGFLTICLPTGLGEMRNFLVVNAADAVIAIGTGWGTLSELALTCRSGKPLIALESWRLPQDDTGTVIAADTPAEAVAAVLRALRRLTAAE